MKKKKKKSSNTRHTSIGEALNSTNSKTYDLYRVFCSPINQKCKTVGENDTNYNLIN